MVPVVAFLLMVVSESSELAVQSAPPAHSRVTSPGTKLLERRSLLFEIGCPADSFDFNIEPQLRFIANKTTTTRSKAEDELQCKNCEESGVPPHINCTNSNTDSRQSAKWSCEGFFPDATYRIASHEIDCEYGDVFRRHCVKKGSCLLTITAGVTGTVDWLLFFFLAQLAVILIGLAIYKSKDRIKSMLARKSRNVPDLRIDIAEARRRGREEIKRLRAERELAAATTTTTPAPTKKESASEESHAMRAPTAAWLE